MAREEKQPTPRNGGGCFIATAAFGSELHPHVQFLRDFRDSLVLKSWFKIQFQKLEEFYYKFSPPIAKRMDQHELLRDLVKYTVVYPFVAFAKVVAFSTLAIVRFKRRLFFTA